MSSSYFIAIDFAVFAIWILLLNGYWIGYKINASKEDPAERALGAEVIMRQLGSIITGSSVLLAGVGAFVSLSKGALPEPAKYHAFYAASWAVVALISAVFTMGVLPPHAPKTNFVRIRGIAFLCSVSLFCCLAAGFRFVFAVYAILFP